jgi:metal-responsive CopG/Arc/MetJ family transcriptional regulator
MAAAMRVRHVRMDEALWLRVKRTLKREQRRSRAELIRQALALGLDELDRRSGEPSRAP